MNSMKSVFCLVILLQVTNLFAQTPAETRLASIGQAMQQVSPLKNIQFRNVGPTVMSGRVTDIEVNPENTAEFYVAYASGGVWHTINNGQSFTPIFDHEASMTVGDMAMNWKTHTLWVGSGEVNSSRSSYAGTGVYISNDTGKTWKHRGLEESHHIGRIVLHPENTQVAWVAVLGHLYTKNKERGIFKTTDGGLTWKQTLFMNDSTGCPDLLLDPSNPSILYAVTWNRNRSAWNFSGCGEGSSIYKSTDGGEHWSLITNGQNGFPQGKGTGRIGIALCATHPNTLYALLDNQNNQEEKKDAEKKINAKDLSVMSADEYLNMDDKKLDDYLHSNAYPEKYTAASTKEAVRNKTYSVKDIADWKLADADANLFNTPIIGAELYRSNDGGSTWVKTHDNLLEGMYFTYGYYFGTIAVSSINPDKIYMAGYPIVMSEDGGKTFKQIDGDNCHPDYHRIWIHPHNDQHIIAGNDGGINISYDSGENWIKANNPPVGQFYAVEVDEATPYNVYGGLQDNGTWTASSLNVENTGWHQSGQYAYKNIGDGDGMQVQVDTRDNATVYAGYQFGNYSKVNKNSGESTDIKPVHDIGQKPYRFNWQTPILLSKHHKDFFFIGSNCLHRSLHQGDQLQTISGDLTANTQKGNVPYATLTTLSESPLKFGLMYTGSDDGLIYCTPDQGYSWINCSQGLPAGLWVSRVIASRFNESRVYASLNGYRNDDFKPYLFMSDDCGKNWKQLGLSLPLEPINVVREDPKDSSMLYVGTDNGLYVSYDRGLTFIRWEGGLPRVAIHDIAIQSRDNEIVLGTHGRSIYIASLDYIQQYPTVKDKGLALMALQDLNYNDKMGHRSAFYTEPFSMKLKIPYFTKDSGIHTFRILNNKGKVMQTFSDTAAYGFNIAYYNLTVKESSLHYFDPALVQAEDKLYYLTPGKYQVELSNSAGNKETTSFELKEKKKTKAKTDDAERD